MFMNYVPHVVNWSADGRECQLQMDNNPLAEFVELPPADYLALQLDTTHQTTLAKVGDSNGVGDGDDDMKKRKPEVLWWSNVWCGIIRGGFEMLRMQIDAHFVTDQLHGSEHTVIQLKLVKMMDQEAPPSED